MIGQVTAAKDYGVIMIGAGKLTTVLLDHRLGTTHGERGLNGLNAVLNVVALVQEVDLESVIPPPWAAMSAQVKLTQRQKIVILQLAGQILESGASAQSHGKAFLPLFETKPNMRKPTQTGRIC